MQKSLLHQAILVILFCIAAVCFCQQTENIKFGSKENWSDYLGGADRNHYSVLTQINKANVSQLKKVWEFNTGDSGQMQCNPLVEDGVLYGLTASNHLFALNAETGKLLWRFNQKGVNQANTNRGISFIADHGRKYIFYAFNSWLYKIEADTGEADSSFGENGRISLKMGLGDNAKDKFVVSNTPGTIFEDIIIMPLRVSEGTYAAPGHIQAFNIHTGKLEWVFHTIPHPGEYGYDTWPENAWLNHEIGGANNWAGMALDKERGIIYIPTGSAAFDFYGGNRKGDNLFANCLIALDARTGKRIWHFQFVHHDIWDRDLPAPPNLVSIKRNGKTIDAVAQVTKTGHVFIFQRETGDPLFPLNEMPVPQQAVKGEFPSLTQPIPEKPRPFTRQMISEKDLSSFSADKDSLLEVFRGIEKGVYRPLTTKPLLLFPGLDGGAEWGGAAVDPEGILYINANEMAWTLSLKQVDGSADTNNSGTGSSLYKNYCSACHGNDLMGNPLSGYPSLFTVSTRLTTDAISHIITYGKGMMPGFPGFSENEKKSVIRYLSGDEKAEPGINESSRNKASLLPYRFNGYTKFVDKNGYPAISPPWGTLTAIDLNTGDHKWQIPLGEYKELKEMGIPVTGTENYGGPVITASGLIFIAATKDERIRAFNKENGKLLWEAELPASGFATPATYKVGEKQFVVIACGGTKLGTKKGSSYVAFALP